MSSSIKASAIIKDTIAGSDSIKLKNSADLTKEERAVVVEWLKHFSTTRMDATAIRELASNISYVGWDPLKTMTEFIAMNRERDEMEFRNALTGALVFFCVRGTNFKKENIIDRSANPLKMKELINGIETLGIKVNAGSGSSMTLSRLAACYPAHTAFVIHSIKGGVKEGDLDAKYCFPHSPQIMSDSEWARVKDAYFTWSFSLNKRINAKNKVKRDQTYDEFKNQQDSIVKAMRSGPMWNEMSADWITIGEKITGITL